MKPAVAIGTDGVVYVRLLDVREEPRLGQLVATLEAAAGAKLFVGIVVPGLTLSTVLPRLDNAAAEAAATVVGQRRRRTARRT